MLVSVPSSRCDELGGRLDRGEGFAQQALEARGGVSHRRLTVRGRRSSARRRRRRIDAVADDLLELFDRAVDQDLGGAVGAPERARDLAVVHAQREAHDQRLAAVVGQLPDAVEHAAELVAALDQLLGRVQRRQLGVVSSIGEAGRRERSR